ncbi:MAG: hypothetical protein CL578_10600 [Alteromonadaceae bacterium]|nr:hypothetical protein [Alteromonadaceae bacterium]
MYDSHERSQQIEAAFLFIKNSDSANEYFLFARLLLARRVYLYCNDQQQKSTRYRQSRFFEEMK